MSIATGFSVAERAGSITGRGYHSDLAWAMAPCALPAKGIWGPPADHEVPSRPYAAPSNWASTSSIRQILTGPMFQRN